MSIAHVTSDLESMPVCACHPEECHGSQEANAYGHRCRKEQDGRSCTCHPSDQPPTCQRKYAAHECRLSYVENQLSAERISHRGVTQAIERWRDLARSMGYDGIEDALLSLQAMKRGPRPVRS